MYFASELTIGNIECVLFCFDHESALNSILCVLAAPTAVISIFYLLSIPPKSLRIKYDDESMCSVLQRTVRVMAADTVHIIRVRSVRWLMIANVLGATASTMMLFIYGLWLQTLFNLDIVGVALFTVIQPASELPAMTLTLSLCIDRNRMGTAAVIAAIGFCEWMAIGQRHAQSNSLSINCLFATVSLSVVFGGHHIFVHTLNSSIFR